MYEDTAAFAESPWYGIVEITGLPGAECGWGTEVWDGDHICFLVTETLRPLTTTAAEILGVKPGDSVWDDDRVKAWVNEHIRIPTRCLPGHPSLVKYKRVFPDQVDRWFQAAEKAKMSFAAWVAKTLDEKVDEKDG